MKSSLILLIGVLPYWCFSQIKLKDSIIATEALSSDNLDSAKVAIDILVDKEGRTISAIYQPKRSTTATKEMVEIAKKRAFGLRWTPSKDSMQSGTVIIKFRLKS